MAVARQSEVQQRLSRLEKEFEAFRKNSFATKTASEYKASTAGSLPIIFTIIAVVGGSYYLLSERTTETTMQLNKRIDDTNSLIRTVKSDLEKDNEALEKDIEALEKSIADIDAKLDRLLLK